MTISSFSGKYRFLSNFYPVEIVWDGIQYPSAEHAYQATKAVSFSDRLTIANAPTASQAKAMGRRVKMLDGWDTVRTDVMEQILRIKFANPELARLLRKTAPRELIEGNHWGDTYWGVCKGKGENHLGKILMRIRDDG